MSILDYIFALLTIISAGMRTYSMKPQRDKSNEKSFFIQCQNLGGAPCNFQCHDTLIYAPQIVFRYSIRLRLVN
jgi:hypothetical protein